MKEVIEKKEVQFVAWLMALVVSIAIPFITYGARIDQLEKQTANLESTRQELTITLTDMQVRLAQIQKDIEYLKLKK